MGFVEAAIRVTRLALVALVIVVLRGAGLAEGAGARELPGRTLTHPTGLAVAPDGAVWIASTYADRLVRFDPATGTTREIQLPLRSHPVGLLVDPRGALWYAASGLGLVGRLAPGRERPEEFPIPAIARARFAMPSPWALAFEPTREQVWFTVQSDGLVGRLGVRAEPQRRGFVPIELELGGITVRPDGIAADGRGAIWVAELGADRLARVDVSGNTVTHVALPRGSRPRGVAATPDGGVWVTLFASHLLLRVDPASLSTRVWPMPSGSRSNPDAIAVDGAGAVWVSEFTGDQIVRFDPRRQRFTRFPLPTPRSGVRALAVDARGRLWFVGSRSGRLGVIE